MKTRLLIVLFVLGLLPSVALAQTPTPLVCDAFASSAKEQRVGYYMGEGAGFYAAGQYDRALGSYSCVIEQIDPQNAGAYVRRALTYTDRQDYDKAIADYSKAISLNSSLPGAYNNRGIAQAALQKYDEALADFDAALKLDANYVLGYSNRAVISAVRGNYEGALVDLQKAVDLSGIQKVVDTLKDPNRDTSAPIPKFDPNHARIYALIGIVRSAQALDAYSAYNLLLGSAGDQRIQSASGSLESRANFDLRLDDGTWLLSADFDAAGVEIKS